MAAIVGQRGVVALDGPGWAVTDGHDVLPGRWKTSKEALKEGYLGVYLLSGVDVVEVKT